MGYDVIGTRMKKNYESISKTKLTRRTPAIIRLDGKAFHTFTKGLERPFDELLMNVMAKTTKYLCENIQGAKIGYTQSDEISILMTDYEKFTTDAWFDYEVQKIVSVSSSICTLAFAKFWEEESVSFARKYYETENTTDEDHKEFMKRLDVLTSKNFKALFDSRVFNIPKEEVANYFYWRQKDASKNSISMLAETKFSHKQLHKKSTSDRQNMLFIEHGINWNDMPTTMKRGTGVIKAENGWKIDTEIPIWENEGRAYIEDLV